MMEHDIYDERSHLLGDNSETNQTGYCLFPNSCINRIKHSFSTLYNFFRPLFPYFIAAIFVCAATMERITFKTLADDMVPFRYFLVLILLLLSLIFHSALSFFRHGFLKNNIDNNDKDETFPMRYILLIAFLETLQFSGLILTAMSVTPTMTLTLLHISTPGLLLFSSYIFVDRRHSSYQIKATILISISTLLSIINLILLYCFYDTANITYSNIIGTFCYMIFALFHSIISLLKEKSIREYRKPIDIYKLNSWLYTYEFFFAFLFSPILYLCQNLFQGTTATTAAADTLSADIIYNDSSPTMTLMTYPLTSFFQSIYQACLCLSGDSITTTTSSINMNELQWHDANSNNYSNYNNNILSSAMSILLPSTDMTITSGIASSIGGDMSTSLLRKAPYSSRNTYTSGIRYTYTRMMKKRILYISDYDENDTTMRGTCHPYLLLYMIIFVISNVTLLECTHTILQYQASSKTKLLSKCILTGLVVSFLFLMLYDILVSNNVSITHIGDIMGVFNTDKGLFNSHVYITDLIAFVLLVWGIYMYESDNEPDMELITELSNSSTKNINGITNAYNSNNMTVIHPMVKTSNVLMK